MGHRGAALWRPSFVFGPLAVIAACSDSPPPDPRVLVTDSGGVHIVESTSPHWADGDGWSVDPESEIDLSNPTTGVPADFYGVSDIARTTTGHIAVAQQYEIRIYSSDGAHHRTIGREGEGPGEFLVAPRLASSGDSLVVFDWRQRRATFYSPTFDLRSVVTLEGGPFEPEFAVNGDGIALLAATTVFDDEGEGSRLIRPDQPVLLLDFDGSVRDTIAKVEGRELVRLRRGDQFLLEAPPFGKAAHMAATPTAFVVGNAGALEFELHGARLPSPVRVRGPVELEVSDTGLESEVDALLGPTPSAELRSLIDEMLELMPAPLTYPAYRSIRVDPTGTIWLERFVGASGRDRPRRWTVFSSEHEWLGDLAFPAGFQAFSFAEEQVFGVTRDALGVESVQVLRLIRPERP